METPLTFLLGPEKKAAAPMWVSRGVRAGRGASRAVGNALRTKRVATPAPAPTSAAAPQRGWLGKSMRWAGKSALPLGGLAGLYGGARFSADAMGKLQDAGEAGAAAAMADFRNAPWYKRLGAALAPEKMFQEHIYQGHPAVAEAYNSLLQRGRATGVSSAPRGPYDLRGLRDWRQVINDLHRARQGD